MCVLRAVQIWSRDVGGSLLTQDGFCEQIYSAAHDVQWTSVLRGLKRSVDQRDIEESEALRDVPS